MWLAREGVAFGVAGAGEDASLSVSKSLHWNPSNVSTATPESNPVSRSWHLAASCVACLQLLHTPAHATTSLHDDAN